MNVLILATTDEGGAGIASRYFNEKLLESGVNSKLVVKESRSNRKNVIVLSKISIKYFIVSSWYKIKIQLRAYFKNYSALFDVKYCFHNHSEDLEVFKAVDILKAISFKPDVIILHWVTNFINANTVKELSKLTEAKILWYMMDNAPLTGGCHYPWSCNGFKMDCSDCPAILKASKKVIAKNILAFKISNLPNSIEVLTCSESDYLRACQSVIFKQARIHKVYLPINEVLFTNGDMKNSKRHFNIPESKRVIFYGSISLLEKRKGSNYFISALRYLQEQLIQEKYDIENIVILIAGNGEQRVFEDLKIQIKYAGFLNEELLVKAYQASDLFVSTSIEDSGPLMINQAIMCGTPVVAFGMGVAHDLVITNYSGYKATLKNSRDLALGIYTILKMDNNAYESMSNNCRSLALEKYGTKSFSDNLIRIINSTKVNG